ncbi:MAG: zf-TFIIB domain-containing protein [Verrucomicrobiales bacterium]
MNEEQTLTCPVDGNPMVRQQHGVVGEYFACKECRGLWVPRTYLMALKRRAALELKRQRALEPMPVKAHSVSLHCPECAAMLVPRVHEMVPVDVCAQCKAIWLDGDEILHLGKGNAVKELREKRQIERGEEVDGWRDRGHSESSTTAATVDAIARLLISMFD